MIERQTEMFTVFKAFSLEYLICINPMQVAGQLGCSHFADWKTEA